MPWLQPLLAHCGRGKMAVILADNILIAFPSKTMFEF